MLKNLFISNYALIDNLEIEFSKGLNIITGETGAGKSVLLGALSLILGQRADASVLSDKKAKCIIEGTFDILECDFESFFAENNLDFDNTVILRREIIPTGKSRAFINDTPVNLDKIKELGEKLVDIHSQHNTLTLQDSAFQLDFIDAYAQHKSLLSDYQKALIIYSNTKVELEKLISEEEKAKSDQDYFQFQFNELDAARLLENEQNELEAEKELLAHAGEINTTIANCVNSLLYNDQPLIANLKEIEVSLQKILPYYNSLDELLQRIKSVNIEIKDIASELESKAHGVIINPDRIQEIDERLDLIYHFQQKHRVNSISELLAIKTQYENKILSITSLETKIIEQKGILDLLHKKLQSFSDSLSANRKKVKPIIEKGIVNVLKKLAMPESQIEIKIESLDHFGNKGRDKVNFLFNANKGGEIKPISKVASGGELSRLMLAIKSLITQHTLLPTVIFDEIDTGVSGEIAAKVGEIMRAMSSNMQVVAITHLPQIAAKGLAHYMVYKETDSTSTYTRIRQLSASERTNEIARMLSGDKVTKEALENAKVLINFNNN